MKLDLVEKIEEKIKDISPKPKWQFLLKDYLLWGVGIASILVGGLAFSVVLYMILNSGWDIYHQIGDSLFGFVMAAMPYFWILVLLIFIILAYFDIKHTKRGYRFKLSHIILTAVVLSIVLGGLLYNVGMGEAMDEAFAQNVPVYREHISRHRDFLNNPDKGVIAGVVIKDDIKIVEEEPKRFIWIKGFDGKIWKIEESIFSSKAWPVGSKVLLTGEKTATSSFEFKTVRPFKGQIKNLNLRKDQINNLRKIHERK